MPTPYDLTPLIPDQDRMSASQWDLNRQVVHRRDSLSAGGFVTFGGVTSAPALPGIQHRWGKLNEELNAGGTAEMSMWMSSSGSWQGWDQDSGLDIEIHAPPVMASGSIDSGKWILAGCIHGRWVALLHEC